MNAGRNSIKLTVTIVLLFVIALAAAAVMALYMGKHSPADVDANASYTSGGNSGSVPDAASSADPGESSGDPTETSEESSNNGSETGTGETPPPDIVIGQPQPGVRLPQTVRAIWLLPDEQNKTAESKLKSAKDDGVNSVVISVSRDAGLPQIMDMCSFADENGLAVQLVFDYAVPDGELTELIAGLPKIAAVYFPADDFTSDGARLRSCVGAADGDIAVGAYVDGTVPKSVPGADCILVQIKPDSYKNTVRDSSKLAQTEECAFFICIDVTDSENLSEKSAYAAIQKKAEDAVGYRGTAVRGLNAFTDENDPAASALYKCLKGVDLDYTGMALHIIEPTETNYSTYGKTFTLRGTANPLYPLTVNGEAVDIDRNGSFIYTAELKTGHNDFAVRHNGSAAVIDAELKIDVIRSVMPNDDREFDGGGFVTLKAVALPGAAVTATVNGKTFTLSEQMPAENEDGEYVDFTYAYELPKAADEKQDLGRVTFSGTFDGYTEKVTGGRLYVKELPVQDPYAGKTAVATVVKDHTEDENFTKTFDPRYTDNSSYPTQYFLAKGMVDVVTGEALGTGDEGNVDCYILSGGVMIHKDDCELSYADELKNNISSASVSTEGKYTVFRFISTQPAAVVPKLTPLSFTGKHPLGYDVKTFAATKVELLFSNTVAVSDIIGFNDNILFSKYEWSRVNETQYKLTLDLKKAGAFYGIRMQVDSAKNLVISFKNPVSVSKADNAYGVSLKGVKIVVDAGHNGNSMSTGTYGYDRHGFEESGLNLIISRKTRERLEALGATVFMTRDEESSDMTRAQRVEKIITSNADLCIAVHHNGVKNEKVYGTSSYYFYPYSKPLSECVYNRMVEMYRRDIYPEGDARHEKCATGCRYYPFYMTRVQELPTMLVEIGYITNKEEYYFLIRDDIQDKVADALTAGIVDYLVMQSK